uniref:Golgi integral membrane protein 4 n=1 Tax=Rhipicephalus appendiculatus TaxID=34631 RepID=A0A131YCL3_RHIAP
MSTAVIMRNSKVRTFLYVLLGCCMLFTVFLLSSTHTKLKDSQESNDKCQQQRDSLSAQLQVVYEHKSRLEKTLQLETTDRKKAEDAVKTVRDQAERDRADARDKIKSLDKELTELKASQAEEFKNLKTSFDTLHLEKEKVDNELANHVALLQHERDSKAKLARQLEEVLQSRKTEGQLDLMVQRQLETCRTETAHLYAKLQQLNAAQSQHVAASGVNKPVANAPDFSAGNGPAHAAAPAPSLAQGGSEPKANAKEDKGAGKLGPPYQVAGAESWPPKVVGGEPSDSLRPIANNARNPVPAAQAVAPPNDLVLHQAAKVSPAVSQAERGLSSMPGKAAPDGMLSPLQPEGKANRGSSELSALSKNQDHQPVGQKPPVVSQPGVPQVALQPSVQAEPSQRPPAQPLARPVAQPVVQEEQNVLHKPLQQPVQFGVNPDPLSQMKGQLSQLNVDQPAGLEQGFKMAEQPPVVNQAPPVLPAPSIAKSQPPAAGMGAKNQGIAQPGLSDGFGGLPDSVVGLEKMPAGDRPVPAKAAGSRGGAEAAAVAYKKSVDAMGLEEGNDLELGAEKVLSNKVPNNGDDLLIGGHAGKAPRSKLARPNQQQQLAAGGMDGGEDDLEYGHAGYDKSHGAEADQLQQQQPNNFHEDGIAANPK